MMKTSPMKRLFSFLLAFVMVLSMVPATGIHAHAHEEEEPIITESTAEDAELSAEETEPAAEITPVEEVTSVSVNVTPDVDLPENDELFAMYAEQVLYGSEMATFGTKARNKLNSAEQGIYDALKEKIEAVAANGGSTVFVLPEISGLKVEWSNTELGVSSIEDTAELEYAFQNQFNADDIIDALLSDCPFDLYWYDKTVDAYMGYEIGRGGINDGSQIIWTTALVSNITFTFVVSEDYASNDNTVTTEVAKIAAAKSAAQAVVDANKDKTDYEKLLAYKEYICNAVAYNDAAAEDSYDEGYGDPWQLIYVFDGDSDTKVVCEGYAKAFQYLCDLSDIDCISVTGKLVDDTGGGDHMWNIVTLEGKNYLVDLTNCDGDGTTNTVGYPDKLFLVGNATGSVATGYSYTFGSKTVSFAYDEDTTNLWTTEELTLAAEDYPVPETPITCTHNFTYTPNENGTHKKYCTQCSHVEIEAEKCSGGNPTCTTPVACVNCGADYLNPDNHEYEQNNGICCDTYQSAEQNQDGYYEISNAGQLYWFARLVNIDGQTSAKVILKADIDLKDRTWYPIGLYDDIAEENGELVRKQYTGTFDGNGHTVSNFVVIGAGSQGLIGYSSKSACVKNLSVNNATVSGWNAGAVLAFQGTVENCSAIDCTVTAYTSATGASGTYAGAIAGTQQATIKNCLAINCKIIAGEGISISSTLAPVGGKTAENCYYVNVSAQNAAFRESAGEIMSTEAQLTSGEIAYKLGSAWGQTIGEEDYPVVGGAKVNYGFATCREDQTEKIYTNEAAFDTKTAHSLGDDAICDVCDTHFAAMVTSGGVVTYYTTLDAAIQAVSTATEANEAVVKVLKSIELDSQQDIDSGVFTLDLNGKTITGSGGTVLVVFGGTVTIDDSGENGTIYCASESSFSDALNIRGGEVTIRNGHIQGNENSSAGSAVKMSGGSLTVTGGTITGSFDGVYASDGTVSITGGTIDGSISGVSIHGGTVSISGGSISGNSYGVHVNGGTVSISGGSISSKAYGVCVTGGDVVITGGTISCDTYDLSVLNDILTLALAEGKTVGATFPGGIQVAGNTTLAKILGEGVAYWVGDKQEIITDKTVIFGDVTIKKACPHAGDKNYTEKGDGTHTWNCTGCNNNITEDHQFNQETLLCICGAASSDAVAMVSKDGMSVSTHTTLDAAIQAVSTATEADEAVVKLLGDIDLTAQQDIKSGVFTLDLNGKDITSSDVYVLSITGGTVTIDDSGENGSISGNGIGVYNDKSTVNISGGSISGEVGVRNDRGTVSISGGSISGETGVINYGGTVSISGGSISGNDKNGYGCGVDNASGTVSISGGSITSSETGVNNDGGTVSISGGSISGEVGVRNDRGTVSISGGSISGNGIQGCGVYVKGGDVGITGGRINGGDGYDLNVDIYTVSTVTLALAEDKTEGATFPDDIQVNGTTLAEILGDGAAYWQNSKRIEVDSVQTDISDGDVVVKSAVCDHSGNTTADDGDCTTALCCDCGAIVVEAKLKHEFNDNGLCSTKLSNGEFCNGGQEPQKDNGVYQIVNAGNLFWIAQQVNSGKDGSFDMALKNDIDLENREWVSIGSNGNVYEGTIDGNGYTISNLYQETEDALEVGFVAFMESGCIRDLTVSGSIETSNSDVKNCGMLASQIKDTYIYNCSVNGEITSCTTYTGGMVGIAFHSVLVDCVSHVALNVTLEDSYSMVGGIVGCLTAGYDEPVCLLNSYSTGNITAKGAPSNARVGGIVGYLKDDAVNNYYSGDIFSSDDDLVVGYAFGEVYKTVTVNGKTYPLEVKHNYYPAGQTGIGDIDGDVNKETAATGISSADFAATTGETALVNQLNNNLSIVNAIIKGHLGLLGKSEWANLVVKFDGESCEASHWKVSGGRPVHCDGSLDDNCICTSCGATNHTWEDATCTAPKTCSGCSATEGNKLGHEYGDDHICDRCEAEEPVYVAFYSLSLKGDIAVNYYMHIDESIQDGTMKFTTPRGGVKEIPFNQANVKTVDEKTYYVFTATVAAKEMTDTIVGQYVSGDFTSEEYDYSVKQYADIILTNKSNSAAFAKAQPLVQAMLTYGAYAQQEFGYNTDNLAAELTDVSKVTAQNLSEFANSGSQGTNLVPLYATSLLLKTETTMRLAFVPDATVSTLTATMNGQPLNVTIKDGYAMVDVSNISAKNLDTAYAVTINDGTETAEVTYTPMTYCYNVLKDSTGTFSATMQDLVRALYLYNQAANEYFE